jgi:hypothetical protein
VHKYKLGLVIIMYNNIFIKLCRQPRAA